MVRISGSGFLREVLGTSAVTRVSRRPQKRGEGVWLSFFEVLQNSMALFQPWTRETSILASYTLTTANFPYFLAQGLAETVGV